MKKLFCVLLALMLACGAALAEPAETPSPVEPATMEEKLTAMIPVLDSLARVLDSAEGAAYAPADPAFVWAQLEQMALNWYEPEGADPAEDGRIVVPAEVLSDYAAASFAGMRALPAPPQPGEGAEAAVEPAEDGQSYAFAEAEPRPVYIVIERYAETETEIRAGFGVYESTYDFRVGGLTAILENAPEEAQENTPTFPFASAPEAEEPRFPLNVYNIFPETEADFADMEISECYLRYVAPLDSLVEEVLLPFSALSWGSKGSSVASMQRRLNALGYSCEGENGTFGSGTLRAVRYFQDALGLPQDGVASVELQNLLFSADAPAYRPYVNLKEGSEGVRVEELQARLCDLGYLGKPADGSFDGRTRDAVVLFQRTAGLGADGIAGPRTLSAIDAPDAPECTEFIDLRAGDSGPRVVELQEHLIRIQYLSGWANGTYDAATVAAVQAYEAANGLDGDGTEASALTIAAMFGLAPEQEPAETPAPTPEPTPEPTPVARGAQNRRPAAQATERPAAEATAQATEPHAATPAATAQPEESEAPAVTESTEPAETSEAQQPTGGQEEQPAEEKPEAPAESEDGE